LRDLGVEIEYMENEGFPPLKITGKKITQTSVNVPANISSQFITSLLLVAGKLENGLEINLVGEVTSRSYIEMTLNILTKFGIQSSFEGNTIKVEPFTPDNNEIVKYLCVGKRNHSSEKFLQRINTGRFCNCQYLRKVLRN
jgi:3-phosphoshikimate 1-carboxyvinyltransferase